MIKPSEELEAALEQIAKIYKVSPAFLKDYTYQIFNYLVRRYMITMVLSMIVLTAIFLLVTIAAVAIARAY